MLREKRFSTLYAIRNGQPQKARVIFDCNCVPRCESMSPLHLLAISARQTSLSSSYAEFTCILCAFWRVIVRNRIQCFSGGRQCPSPTSLLNSPFTKRSVFDVCGTLRCLRMCVKKHHFLGLVSTYILGDLMFECLNFSG